MTKGVDMRTKIIHASEYAKLDSNVITGGGTDDTKALQDLLNKALVWGGLHLIMDGAALITGLKIHSNTTIECLNKDCGFFLKGQSNCTVVENYERDYDIIKSRNISLLGGTYNHNCPEQEHHIKISDPAINDKMRGVGCFDDGTLIFATQFIGVENLILRDVTIRNQRTWAMLCANWKHIEMQNITIEVPDKVDGQNQDGLHFWGPGQFLTLRNIKGDAGDDFIALAPDEHDKVSDITDVLIDGVYLDHADQGIRMLSRGTGRLDRVTVRNVSGTYRSFGFFINAWFTDDTCGQYGNIIFENIDLRPEAPNYSYRPPFLFQIGGKMEHLTFRNIHDHHSRYQRPLFDIGGPFAGRSRGIEQTYVDQITIDGFNVINKAGLSVPPVVIDAQVGRMRIRNVDISCEPASDTPVISVGSHGKLGSLMVNGLTAEGIGKLIDAPEGSIAELILWNIAGV
jgi:hypothetical protein